MAVYVNEWGERENAWYEVKRFPIGSNGNVEDDRYTTYHQRKADAIKAQKKAISTGKYEAVFIDFVAENSGIID